MSESNINESNINESNINESNINEPNINNNNFPENAEEIHNIPAYSNNMKRIGFHESQEALLCGKHALNNILQEEKFVWEEDTEDDYIGGENPMIQGVKINTLIKCKSYEVELKQQKIAFFVSDTLSQIKKTMNGSPPNRNSKNAEGKPNYKNDNAFSRSLDSFVKQKSEYNKLYSGKSDDEIRKMIQEEYNWYELPEDEKCDVSPVKEEEAGQLPILIIPKLLDILYYDYKIFTGYSDEGDVEADVKHRVIRALNELEKSNCIGVLINVGAWHWTAIVKYRKNCISLTHSTGTQMYAYADSLHCKLDDLENCKTLPELKKYLNENVNIQGAVFIYSNELSYVSQALKNRDSMENNPLNRIKIDGGKRKSRKLKRKTKRSKTHRRNVKYRR